MGLNPAKNYALNKTYALNIKLRLITNVYGISLSSAALISVQSRETIWQRMGISLTAKNFNAAYTEVLQVYNNHTGSLVIGLVGVYT